MALALNDKEKDDEQEGGDFNKLREEDKTSPNLSSSNPSEREQEQDGAVVCPVCYDSCSELVDLVRCPHVICSTCLVDYIQFNLSIQRIPIPCSRFPHCRVPLSSETISSVLQGEEEMKNKYMRLERLQDPTLVACPRCGEPVAAPAPAAGSDKENDVHASKQVPSKNWGDVFRTPTRVVEKPQRLDKLEEDDDDDPNARQCLACHHNFCFEHGDLHPKLSCRVYAFSRHAEEMRQTQASLRAWTRPCSHCGCAIFKSSGCDHVVCAACHQDMCFKCGTHIHLSGTVFRSCANCNQGFIDHRYNRQWRIRLALFLPVLLPGWILYTLATTVVAVFSAGFCCCFCCGKNVPRRNNANTSSSHGKLGDGEQPFAPWKGIRRGFVLTFLPFVVCFRDFGLDCGCLEGVVEQSLEMPSMPVPEKEQQGKDPELGLVNGNITLDTSPPIERTATFTSSSSTTMSSSPADSPARSAGSYEGEIISCNI